MSADKWQLQTAEESSAFYEDCGELQEKNRQLMGILRELLVVIRSKQVPLEEQCLDPTLELVQIVVDSYASLNSRILSHETMTSALATPIKNVPAFTSPSRDKTEISYSLNPTSPAAIFSADAVHAFKTRRCREKLWQDKMTIVFLMHQLINDVLEDAVDEGLLTRVFQLSTSFNALLAMGSENDKGVATSCKNTCPILLYPLRKLSVTRLLQIAGQMRAERACHALAAALLDNYRLQHGGGQRHHGNKAINRGKTYVIAEENAESAGAEKDGELTTSSENDNSSIEIYRALTGHITPPCDVSVLPSVEKTAAWLQRNELAQLDWSRAENLVAAEETHVLTLLNVAATSAPALLGRNGVHLSKKTGAVKVGHSVRSKAVKFYQQVVWGEAGTHMEHFVLWWSPIPFGTLAPNESKQLRLWLLNLSVSGNLPAMVAPAVHNLADGLGCHVTATKWDQLFRHALVHGQRQGSNDKTKDVGQLFADLLHSLITLSNDCETTADWLSAPPLEELPLVEQIPILHRLDHSVHTTRLWAANKAKTLINTWKVDKFFEVSQMEVEHCLSELRHLQLASHRDLSKVQSQHVLVCAKMRAKLAAEVTENIDKLKKLPGECIDVMASVCRTFCLANLHMVFPEHRYWRRTGPLPVAASSYVEKYLDRVLKPVIMSLTPLPVPLQQKIGGMTLRILCEAWLDHIYARRIKFSEWGANQLKADFSSVPHWINQREELTTLVMQSLSRHEVLRRCEGVGKLLLRKPGERVNMLAPPRAKHNQGGMNGTATQEAVGLDLLPAEMFVPNQQQWLELRASRRRGGLCCTS